METPKHNAQPRLLSDNQYSECLAAARSYLQQHGSIRNRQLRAVTGLTYDQAISFFKRATTEYQIVRLGTSSGTHYILTMDDRASPA